MNLLYQIFVDPFMQMGTSPDLLVQTLWEGLVGGVLYSLIALGFVLIFKASGVFNFAQGIMMVFAALTLVGLYEKGVPAWLALILAIGVMYLLALGVERVVLRPLVNQPDIMLFMATFGLTYVLIGAGELVFGGNPKPMPVAALGLPTGGIDIKMLGGMVSLQKIDIAAAVIASTMVAGLALFFQKTRIGRALRAVADDHQAALSVGISLNQIWVIVWFTAGIVALATPFEGASRSGAGFIVRTGGEAPADISADRLVLAAGLGAQSCARLVEDFPPERIPALHFGKGSYFALTGVKAPFSRLIYPPPIPGALGTHYRRDLGGVARFGPDLQFVEHEDYVVDPARAASFYATARRFWPALPDGALAPDYAGIRPKLHGAGEAQGDFVISSDVMPNLVTLFGIESPGLTSSLAIGEEVAERLAR